MRSVSAGAVKFRLLSFAMVGIVTGGGGGGFSCKSVSVYTYHMLYIT